MTESKHTPGPWWADDDGCIAAGNGTEDTYQTVADVFYNAANAALIAAAPDMLSRLEATRDAIEWALSEATDAGRDVPSALSQALQGLSLQMDANSAAIAKAEGR
jgi:hypothetical protein